MLIQYVIFLLIPLIICFCGKFLYKHTISYKEFFIQFGVTCIVVLICVSIGFFGQIQDQQYINGELISKHKIKDQHTETYSCRCRQVGKTRKCSTCRRKVYTVKWYAKTTVGSMTYADSRGYTIATWMTPDPNLYTDAKEGDPVTATTGFKNYVNAVPQSLFYKNKVTNESVPDYPKIHSIYKVDRVVTNSNINLEKYNILANEYAKKQGHLYKVNPIYIITDSKERNYKYTVQNAWKGAKINDVVVLISLYNNTVLWADAFTYANSFGNEQLTIEIRDALESFKLGEFDFEKALSLTNEKIALYYKRQNVENFEYLEKDIEFALWKKILIYILTITMSIGLTIYFHKNEI